MRISEVVQLVGLPKQRIHEYEKAGIALKHERAHTFDYDEADIERLWMIKLYKELGKTVPEIREILSGPNYHREEALADLIEELKQKKKEIDKMIRRAELYYSTGLSMHAMIKVFPGLRSYPYTAVEKIYQLYAELYLAAAVAGKETTIPEKDVAGQLSLRCSSSYESGALPSSAAVQSEVPKWLSDAGITVFEAAAAVQTRISTGVEEDYDLLVFLQNALHSYSRSLEAVMVLHFNEILKLSKEGVDPCCSASRASVFAMLKCIIADSELSEMNQFLTEATREETQAFMTELQNTISPWQSRIRASLHEYVYELYYPKCLEVVEKQLKERRVRFTKRETATIAEKVTSRVIGEDLQNFAEAAEFAWKTIVAYVEAKAEAHTHE